MSFQQNAFQQNAFQVQVEATSSPSALDEEGNWWAGIQHCAVGITKGLAATALSLNVAIAGTFNQQDEFPTPIVAPGDGGAAYVHGQRKVEQTTYQRWYQADELPAHAFEDDSWKAPQWVKASTTPFTAWSDDDFAAPVATLTVEDDYWLNLESFIVKPVVKTFGNTGSEDLPTPIIAPSDGANTVFAARARAETQFQRWWPTEDIVPAVLGVNEEPWQVFVTIQPKIQIQGPDWHTDQYPTSETPTVAPGDGANYSFTKRARVQTVFQRWNADDDVVPSIHVIEDDGPELPRNKDEALYTIWAENEEIVPQPPTPEVAPPESGGFPAFSQRAQSQTVFQRWYQDEEIVPPPTPLGVTEDYWQQPYSIPQQNQTSFPVHLPIDEEFPALTAPPQPPVVEQQTPAGRRKPDRYIARYKGEDYEFSSVEALEEFIEQARLEQAPKPKRNRATVRIELVPEFAEEIAEVVEPPKRLSAMPTGAAMAQVRRIEQILLQVTKIEEKRLLDEEEDDILLWLI